MSTAGTDQSWEGAAGLASSVDALGSYHLLRPLAAGGMARVWLAVDSDSGREVAVKRMLPSLAADEELCRAFTDEGQIGLQLQHPNIVDTIEMGEASTATGIEPYLVLELLQGRALIDLLRVAARQKRDVPLGVAIRIVADAARGLAHAHQLTDPDGRSLGLVHRDVTPHNLFVCANGIVKLLDFGIATARSQTHRTRTGTLKGKFAYLAPEQIRGEAPDPRLDVFTLGVVMYELLTGRPLFRGGNDAETLHRILTLEIPSPQAVRPEVPSELAAVALRALERDRDRRFPGAAAFADALDTVASAAGIEATNAEVRAFTEELFPNDAREHAEDAALVRRTYEHLSSGSLRTLGSNPWITPPDGAFVFDGPPSSRLRKLAFGVGAICMIVGMALLTATLLRDEVQPVATAAQKRDPAAPRASLERAAAPLPPPTPGQPVPAELFAPTLPGGDAGLVASNARKQAHPPTGRLRIGAHPWAEVIIDGRSIGTTPMRATVLAEGLHQVRLRNRDLGTTVNRRVDVQAGKETALVVNLFVERERAN